MGRGTITRVACLLVLVGGCRSQPDLEATEGAGAVSTTPAEQRSRAGGPSLKQLTQACGDTLGRIGSYRLSARSRLERSGKGLVPKLVEQQVELRGDGTGRYAARKTTHPQYGSEVVWDGQWIYSRLRYNQFTRRPAQDPHEPQRLLERFCGLLPAYLRLLGPSLRLQPAPKTAKRAGRVVKRLLLVHEQHPEGVRRWDADARKWRNTVKIESLTGQVDWDEDKQVPLATKIEARWTFTPPAKSAPETGIPRELGAADAGRMSLVFEQQIDQLGTEQRIAAPPADQLATRVRRTRLEIERQMTVGERPLVPGFGERAD